MRRATRPRAEVKEPTAKNVVTEGAPRIITELPPPDIEKTAADFLVEQVPGAPRWKVLVEVDSILRAWKASVKAQRSLPSSETVIRRAQKVALHADRLFAAMQQLDVGEGQPGPFCELDWRRAHDPLLKVVLAASLIAPPSHKPGPLLMFVTSLSTALPRAQAENRDRLRRHKPPNLPKDRAVHALRACFQRHNTVAKAAKAREKRFVLRALEAGGLVPKRYTLQRLVRDHF